jgi:uncharacterized protein YuzE
MKLRYYEDTDTLVLVLSDEPSTESAEVARNVVVDLDAADNVVAIEIEHARSFFKPEEIASGKLSLESIRRAG